MAGLCEGGNEPPSSLKASKSDVASVVHVERSRTQGRDLPPSTPLAGVPVRPVEVLYWQSAVDFTKKKMSLSKEAPELAIVKSKSRSRISDENLLYQLTIAMSDITPNFETYADLRDEED
ncbi:hypothetical protein ANN_20008 [Periplaneta americana]|uniref:Uncharacterized protein n=1 Tax=Periplaneta americana TaxID=6978 RepID=A0ABQ8SBG3_PERAM|nr:hypothetical protein ANN_20008 [Periplaneta americana]